MISATLLMNPHIELFWKKVDEVGTGLLLHQDYKAVKPALREILEVVKAHPEMASEFEDAFIRILSEPQNFSCLVVSYCMHYLRFPGVRAHAEKRLQQDRIRTDMHARHVLEAYSSDWILEEIFE